MQRLRPLGAAACCWRRLECLPPYLVSHHRRRTLICCARTAVRLPAVCRPLSTTTPLYRHQNHSQRQQEAEDEEELEEEDEEEEEDEADRADDQPQPSTAESTTLRLKYLLRSDFFTSLLQSTYPNLTPLHHRTHLSAFLRTASTNHHLLVLAQRLVDGLDAGDGGMKRSRRNKRVRVLREIAEVYVRFVADETGEEAVMEERKMNRRMRRDMAAAVERRVAEQEARDDEEEDEEDQDEDDEGDAWSDESEARRQRVASAKLHRPKQPYDEQQSTSSTFLRGHGGRLRYDPSLAFLADLSQPHEAYPRARSLDRKIILHTGPTNSGKTHAAMQALQSAGTGIYAAPLRLLAWEQYDRMMKRGVKAELVTGQELETTDDATHTSSTIEMVSTERVVDVAVIDEVQMTGSEDRGGSWTRALLGVAAKTVHVCGDLSVVGLIEDLCSVMGEELEVVRYERLTPLHLSPPLISLANLRRGDCIIAFSRSELYALKRQIETHTNLRSAIIYGSLPPTLRRQQAEQFNMVGGPYDVLVATDAVGMGLNLSIGRIIFSSLVKFDGQQERTLTVRETLQIAGRAGRFAGVFDTGYVTTLTRDKYHMLKRLMNSKLDPLTHAGLGVSLDQLEQLAVHRPDEALHALLRYMEQFAALDDLYFLTDLSQWIAVARLLRSFASLTLHERYVFCLAPISADKSQERATLLSFVHQYTSSPTVSWRPLAKWRSLSRLGSTASDLLQLEDAWKSLDVYVWLSRRLGEDRFVEREEAEEMREQVSEMIAAALAGMSETELRKRRRLKLSVAERRQAKQDRRRQVAARDAGVEWTDVDEEEDGDAASLLVREATIDVLVESDTAGEPASTSARIVASLK